MAPGVAAIDWSAPWFEPWRELGAPAARAVRAEQPLHDVLNGLGKSPVRFVPQSTLPVGEAYESYIFNSKQCPVRDDVHDFFNGMCWNLFPQTKQRLNEFQAAQIAADGLRAVRGPVRDALTLFDENAAFLDAPDALWAALVAKDWTRLFVELRPLWSHTRLVVFGHAALEKLVSARKALVVHVYRSKFAITSIALLDLAVAEELDAGKLAAKPFAPLPVLGVPGWWPANDDPAFYADAAVFRPPREVNAR